MDNIKELQQTDWENNQNYRQMLFDYQLRISHILKSFTDGYFEVSADWIIKFWNKEAERLLLKESVRHLKTAAEELDVLLRKIVSKT